MTEPIAKTSIEIEAKITQLEAALKKVRSDMEATASAARTSADKIKGAYDSVDAKTIAEQQAQWTAKVEETGRAMENANREAAQSAAEYNRVVREIEDSYTEVATAIEISANEARAAERQHRSVSGTLDSMAKAGASLRSALTKIAIPVAVVLGLSRVADKLQEAGYEAENFGKSLDKALDSGQAKLSALLRERAGISDLGAELIQARNDFRTTTDQITDELEKKLSEKYRRVKDGSLVYRYIVGGSSSEELTKIAQDRLKQAATDLENTESQLRKRAQKKREEEERKAAVEQAKRTARDIVAAQEEILQQSRDLTIELLPEEDQIKARADAAIKEIRRIAEESGGVSNEFDEQLSEYQRLVEAKKAIDLKAISDRIEAEKQAELEKAAEVAKRYEEAMTAAFQRAADALKFSLGDTFGDTGALVRALNETARAVRERGRI